MKISCKRCLKKNNKKIISYRGLNLPITFVLKNKNIPETY